MPALAVLAAYASNDVRRTRSLAVDRARLDPLRQHNQSFVLLEEWEASSGKELLTLRGHKHFVTRVVFSPDGQRLASASNDRTVKVWEASSGKELLTLRGHTKEVTHVAFSPDGQSPLRTNDNRPGDADASQG
jgi:WD40 repeat protein